MNLKDITLSEIKPDKYYMISLMKAQSRMVVAKGKNVRRDFETM